MGIDDEVTIKLAISEDLFGESLIPDGGGSAGEISSQSRFFLDFG